MSDPKYLFQYCPKLVLFSSDWQSIFLARRHGESDYDGIYSFVGGKLEVTDEDIRAGIKREKDEELGSTAHILLHIDTAYPVLFRKKDGSNMIVPHYLAQFASGEIKLNLNEYSEYKWIPLDDLAGLEPKIPNIPNVVDWALKIHQIIRPGELIEI